MGDPPLYSFDTSAIVNGWRKNYPPDVFPPLWEKLDELIDSGKVIAISEVLVELEKQDDEVYVWAKRRRKMFLEIDTDIQIAVAEIMRRFPRLVDTSRSRSAADPFVIALARVKGCAVVTEESMSGSIVKPRIPDVCSVMGIRAIRLLQVVREQGWVFKDM